MAAVGAQPLACQALKSSVRTRACVRHVHGVVFDVAVVVGVAVIAVVVVVMVMV